MDRRRIALVLVVLACCGCASDGAQRMPAGGGTIVDAPPSSGDPQAKPDGGAQGTVSPTAGAGGGPVAGAGSDIASTPSYPQRRSVPLDFDALGFTAADLLAVAAGTYRATFAEPIGEIEWVVPDKAEKVTLASVPTGRWLEVDVDSYAVFAGTRVAGGAALEALEPSAQECVTCATGTDYIYLEMYFDSSALPTSFFDAQPQARGCPAVRLILSWRYQQVELMAFQILDGVRVYNGPKVASCYAESAPVR